MDDRTFEALELSALVELLARHVQSPLGKRHALALLPSTNQDEIGLALDLTSECARYLGSGETFGLSGIEDPEPALAQLQIEQSSLAPHQILAMERLISTGTELRNLFKDGEGRESYPLLYQTTSKVPDLRLLLA